MSKWLTKRNFFILFSIAIVILIFIYIVPVSVPIILALLTALLIDPLVQLAIVKLKWKRKIAVISVFMFILVLISSILYFTVNKLIGKIIDFAEQAPDLFNKLSGMWIDMQTKMFQYTSGLPIEVVNSIQRESNTVLNSMRESILHILSSEQILLFATDIPNLLVSLIVYIIALFLFMLELPNLKFKLFERFTESTAKKVRIMVTRLNAVLIGFMKAQLLVSFIILAVAFVGLLIVAPKYAVAMSLVIWIIDIVPILGSIIVLAPWALYHFISGDVATGTQLATLAIVLLLIRRIVEPKVMGSHIGLSPLPTLIAMFIGLKLIGFLGFFIGPLLVILFTTAREAGIIKLDFKI
ncbi:sporulation integral membrane protein YtvI [Sporosarcina siberiensis]|uniref:Sporulation integral membrane protein YtvI n=1 Tax=Sporosarcina siberiensis TaxID=1365606 RepID=A0ABW4SHI3_9BACL